MNFMILLLRYCGIEWFIGNQAFSPSVWFMIQLLAHTIPTSPVSKLSLFLSLPVCRRSRLLTAEAEGGGQGAKSYDGEKAWSSTILNHSILSDTMAYPLVKLVGIGSTIPRVYQRTVRLPSDIFFSAKINILLYFHTVYSTCVDNMPRQVLVSPFCFHRIRVFFHRTLMYFNRKWLHNLSSPVCRNSGDWGALRFSDWEKGRI